MRLALAALERRIAKAEQRARVRDVLPLLVVDTLAWPMDEQQAYADADESTRTAMERAHAGPPPVVSNPLSVAVMVIARQPIFDMTRFDDEPDVEPSACGKPSHEPTEADRRRDAEISAAERFPIPPDIDATPDGDPSEPVYVDPQSGYPVTRREHQARRQRLREAIERDRQRDVAATLERHKQWSR